MPAGLYRASLSVAADHHHHPQLSELAKQLAAQPRADTEFRATTYRAQLCLVQVSAVGLAACTILWHCRGWAGAHVCGAGHRQGHARLTAGPGSAAAGGRPHPTGFDTQIAASLTGLPAQIGYAELVRRLLGHELSKAHTRTDWSQRRCRPSRSAMRR
jgi:ribonuclease D